MGGKCNPWKIPIIVCLSFCERLGYHKKRRKQTSLGMINLIYQFLQLHSIPIRCVSAKLPHQEIRWNYGILYSDSLVMCTTLKYLSRCIMQTFLNVHQLRGKASVKLVGSLYFPKRTKNNENDNSDPNKVMEHCFKTAIVQSVWKLPCNNKSSEFVNIEIMGRCHQKTLKTQKFGNFWEVIVKMTGKF